MYKKIKNKILELREQGKSYTEIQKILGCSKGTISFHCGKGQKLKSKNRKIKYIKKHPYIRKIENFINRKQRIKIYKNKLTTYKKLILSKINKFIENNKMSKKFTVEDVINKFGITPKCYLTGIEIDIYQPRTYHFDHKIPISRGGDNSIENLGICTKQANMAKTDMTEEEFITFCNLVSTYRYKSS